MDLPRPASSSPARSGRPGRRRTRLALAGGALAGMGAGGVAGLLRVRPEPSPAPSPVREPEPQEPSS